ncbi:MAG: hypothetical protein ACOYD1_07840 [Candidatus Nanopelagicales bacterium]
MWTKCENCHGSGVVVIRVGLNDYDEADCKCCKGSGHVAAGEPSWYGEVYAEIAPEEATCEA